VSKFTESALGLNLGTSNSVPKDLSALLSRFSSLSNEIRLQQVEAATRIDFINPLLEILGWDVANRLNRPYTKREVTYEPRQRVDGSLKAPDYSLGIDGKRKFFIEAKRPSEHIESNRNHSYQLRRYSWSAGLPFGVLTDFEEFAIYDCSFAPQESDAADVGRLLYIRYSELIENWPVIAAILSRDAVAKGSLELLAEKTSFASGEKQIDTSFLKTMRFWRKKLAQDVASENLEMTADRIDFETQTLLNKTIFLRILEDRGFEKPGALIAIATGENDVKAQLAAYFNRAHDKYNSGLFSGRGLGSASLAKQSIELSLSAAVLKDFIQALYFPNPFEFSVMPLDVLGRIYELMLGEEVVFTDESSREIEIKLKPEVKKRGGVFYTPSPIVDYIVEETIGPLIEGKKPTALSKIKIVDPAAGSGSFLVAVFQFLIHHVTDQLAKNDDKKVLEVGVDGQLRIPTKIRKDLLTSCIFGVDIDAQAVEVCKLSLLLLVVENDPQLQFEVGHILPSLDSNVVCGNSLIGDDFEQALLQEEFDSDYNPFNWSNSFPEVFAQGGFDAVVGNPPYLNVDSMWGTKDKRLGYLKAKYPHIHTDKTDLLFYFIEKGVSICKGELAFIVSRSFLEADKALKLRGWLAANTRIREVLDFRDALVFPKVGINTAIIRITKSLAVKESRFRRWKSKQLPMGYDASTLRNAAGFDSVTIPKERIGEAIWSFGQSRSHEILEKMDRKRQSWSQIAEVGKGMETGLNKAFEVSEELIRNHVEIAEYVKPRARNSEIKQFRIHPQETLSLYFSGSEKFEELPVAVQVHLEKSRAELEERAAFRRGDCAWWQYSFPLHQNYFQKRKIVCPSRAPRTCFAADKESAFVYLTDTSVIYIKDEEFPIDALVTLLNSDIANFRFEFLTKLIGGGQREYFAKQILNFPVPFATASSPEVVELDEIGKELTQLNLELNSTLLPAEQNVIIIKIEKLKSRAEIVIGELYGLTDSDRAEMTRVLQASDKS
jgi:type I restriction-modification system DNA methylase subunit